MSPLLRLIEALRGLPDRLRHSGRRKAAIQRLRDNGAPQSILVVCQGNLCRSPYAAAVLRKKVEEAGLDMTVQSAGFFASNRPSPADAIAAAAARGLDIAKHRSQVVNRELVDKADLIVLMDPLHARAVSARNPAAANRAIILGDLDPAGITSRVIPDPYGAERSAFDDCYARIDRCIAELSRTLQEAG